MELVPLLLGSRLLLFVRLQMTGFHLGGVAMLNLEIFGGFVELLLLHPQVVAVGYTRV